MTLYLMRHGETDWNVKNRVLGKTDIPLNKNGISQAKKTAQIISNIKLDKIYSSQYSRAVETAKTVCSYQKQNCSVEPLECLNEQDFGVFEGVDRNNEEYQSEKRIYFKRYENGESYFDVVARVYPFLQKLKDSPDENVLIVTHGGICRIIHNYFSDMTNEDFASFTLKNCELRKYKL